MSDLGRNTQDGFLPQVGSVEDIMKRITGDEGGWDSLNKNNPVAPMDGASKNDVEDLKRNFAKAFSTPAGEKVLEHLLDISLRRGCSHPDINAGIEQEALYGRERKGQNSIVVTILKLTHDGRHLPAPKAKPTRKKK